MIEHERERRESAQRKKKSAADTAIDMLDTITYKPLEMIDDHPVFIADQYPDKKVLCINLLKSALIESFSSLAEAYDGSTMSGNTVNGTGTFVFKDGSKYVGSWMNGKANGNGRFIYAKDRSYKGEFSSGYASGRGIYADFDGNTYDGEYSKGLKHGKGIYTVKEYPYIRLDSRGKVFKWKSRRREEGVLPATDDYGKPMSDVEIDNVYEVECREGVYKKMHPFKGKTRPGS
jgi:hypothetical protein